MDWSLPQYQHHPSAQQNKIRPQQPDNSCFKEHTGPLYRHPTTWLFIGSALTVSTGVYVYLSETLPIFISVMTITLGLYYGFTVLHDGVHGAIKKNSFFATLMPHIWGFLLTFSFPFFQGVHIQHHAHTNIKGQDPDYVLSSLSKISGILLGGIWIYCSYQYHFFSRRLWRNRWALFEVVACDIFYLGILAYAIYDGWAMDLFLLWILPLIITLYLLVYTFDYLPHFPHHSSERLHCARAYGGKLLSAWMCAQNYHLVHHLWPAIPWYRYRKAFKQVYPELKRLGCQVHLP